jgi:hypothetical protein
MVFYILYLVLFFYIFYFILATPLYSVFPFFIWPRWSPPFIQSIKTKINFYLSSIRSCSCCYCSASSRPRESSSVDCSYLQKCVRIKKLCKTHYKCHYTTMIVLNTHLFYYSPSYLSSYPSKKKQLFFIHFAFSLSISKKCCVDDYLGM